MPSTKKVGVFHPIDPFNITPGGIDRFIHTTLATATSQYTYRIFGVTGDTQHYPLGELANVAVGMNRYEFIPVLRVENKVRSKITLPLIVRYCLALLRLRTQLPTVDLDYADFHRIEPSLFVSVGRAKKTLIHHTDMAALRNPCCDIEWRRAPHLYELLEAFTHRRMDRVLCVNQSAVKRYCRLQPSISARFEWIPTAYDDRVFFFRADRQAHRKTLCRRLGLDVVGPIILFVGRLDHSKDPLLLVHSFFELLKKLPACRLIFIGDGQLRGAVAKLASDLDLTDKCKFLGVLDAEQVSEAMSGADVLAITSAYEGMPIAVLEALACGVPVVSTDVGEVSQIVNHKHNGYIVAERAPQAIAKGLYWTLTNMNSLSGARCIDSVRQFSSSETLGRLRA